MKEDLDEALWWVIRYVSGSLTDPDWDWGKPLTLDVDQAMEVAARHYGNEQTRDRTLSRYLLLEESVANDMLNAGRLEAKKGITFQSFTTGGMDRALEIGREIHPDSNLLEVVITAVPDDADVLFGVADVKACRKPDPFGLREQWSDWHHQDEVLVRVNRPLACTVHLVGR